MFPTKRNHTIPPQKNDEKTVLRSKENFNRRQNLRLPMSTNYGLEFGTNFNDDFRGGPYFLKGIFPPQRIAVRRPAYQKLTNEMDKFPYESSQTARAVGWSSGDRYRTPLGENNKFQSDQIWPGLLSWQYLPLTEEGQHHNQLAEDQQQINKQLFPKMLQQGLQNQLNMQQKFPTMLQQQQQQIQQQPLNIRQLQHEKLPISWQQEQQFQPLFEQPRQKEYFLQQQLMQEQQQQHRNLEQQKQLPSTLREESQQQRGQISPRDESDISKNYKHEQKRHWKKTTCPGQCPDVCAPSCIKGCCRLKRHSR